MPTVFMLFVCLVLLFIAGLAHINWRLKTMSDKTDELIATVAAQSTVIDSAIAALNGQADNTAAAVREAVTAALEADANADQASIDAANAAIDTAIEKVKEQTAALAAVVPQGTVAEGEEPAPAPAEEV